MHVLDWNRAVLPRGQTFDINTSSGESIWNYESVPESRGVLEETESQRND